jgi:eukaryotic-like serine/threonine-protein kinase
VADRALDARTDVFALGCVLFECLTGQAAFSGAHVLAVLAKVLREEAPRVRQLRPELSPPLDDLVARMLSKDKQARPADGTAFLRELDALGSVSGGVPQRGSCPSVGLSGGEQRFVSVMLALMPHEPDRISAIVKRHGGDLSRLANGAWLVTMSGRGATSEQVVAGTVCALELHAAFPPACIALSTGKAPSAPGGPPGALIDEAAALLAKSASAGVRVDKATATLLGERFEVRAEGGGVSVVSRRSVGEPPRTLLGKPTPFVGRDRELGLLEATLRESIDESVARAVLVTGPAGQGKSRLRHEFVRKVREQGSARILIARADPVGAGSSLLLARQLVRQAAGLREGDPAPEQEIRLRAYIAELCATPDSPRIADFLGELVGIRSSGRPGAELRSAREDAGIMAAGLARYFGEWLGAECARQPLLVVLEDLHWADSPSVAYFGDALAAHAARPFMVLALGRPEVGEKFPNMWARAERQDVRLGRLPARAAERLGRAALGDVVSAASLARTVERADGNALYLEELVRNVAEGRGDELPETVLALVQSRIERLENDARRIVRAASVFGEVFWRGGVGALIASGSAADDLDAWLDTLTQREVITRVPESRFTEEREYTFRHGLLREAAYAMLTETDRSMGHRLAGEWLEAAGETGARTMADHFESGGQPHRALPWLVRGSLAALETGNLKEGQELGLRGMACGAEGIARGALTLILGTISCFLGDHPATVEHLGESMRLLPNSSTRWFQSAATYLYSAWSLDEPALAAPVVQAIMTVPVEPEPTGYYASAVSVCCVAFVELGQVDLARSLLARAEAIGAGVADPEALFVQNVRNARGYLDLVDGELGPALARLAEARRACERSGRGLNHATTLLWTLWAVGEAGRPDRAAALFREQVEFCEPRRIDWFLDLSRFYLGLSEIHTGRGAAAREVLAPLLMRQNRMLASAGRALVALSMAQEGDLEGAEREARTSFDGGGHPLGTLALVESGAVDPPKGSSWRRMDYEPPRFPSRRQPARSCT